MPKSPSSRRRGAALLALVALGGVLAAGCAPLAQDSPTASPSASSLIQPVSDGGTLTLAATSPITDWNPLSAAGDTTGARQQQWPLYPHPFLTNVDTSVVVNPALLSSAEVTSTSPMTVVYKIRPEAVWSDGTPISVDDFVYTQAVQDPSKCKDCKAAFTSGYPDIQSITGSDNGKTVRMVYKNAFAEWRSPFNYLLPAHIAKGYGDLATSFNTGFGKNVPAFSGGPYIVDNYTDGISLTLKKNPKWYGEGPHLDTIITRYIKGQGEQVTALQSGEVQMIYQTPTVDTAEQVKNLSGLTIQNGSTLTYYHLGMKTTGDVMSDPALRKAIYTAFNFDDMRKRTVGQYAPDLPLMKSAVYVPGQKVGGADAYQDNTTALGMGSGNVQAAKDILTKAGYKITDGKLILPSGAPLRTLTFLTLSTDQLRMDLAQIAQQQLKEIGITIAIDPADGARYSPALRDGSFDIMATGTALDLGVLSIQQWYGTKAPRSFGYTNANADDLMAKAATELDPKKQVELMNKLDQQLLSDGVVMPLFASPWMAAYSNKYANIFVNPSKYGTTMNIEQWGLKK